MSSHETPTSAAKTNWFIAGPAALLAVVLLVLLVVGYFNFDDGRHWWGEFYDCRGALELYIEEHGGYPPAVLYSKDGVALCSWRVLLLPYLRGGTELQHEFRRDEPWDSPHNRTLLAKMPSAFRPPASKQSRVPEGQTVMRAVVRPGTVFADPQSARPKEFNWWSVRPLLILEAGEPAPWTKPENYILLTDEPLPRLAGLYADGYRSSRIPSGPVAFVKRGDFEVRVRTMFAEYEYTHSLPRREADDAQ